MIETLVKNLNRVAADRNIYLYFLILYALLILIFSVVPAAKSGMNSGLGAHVSGYAVLSFSAVLFLRARAVRQLYLKAFLFAGSYGFLIEMIQYFIPYRQFDLFDILVNFTAAVSGTLPGYFLIKKELI